MSETENEQSSPPIYYEGLELTVENSPSSRAFSIKVPSDLPEYKEDGAAKADFTDGTLLGFHGQTPMREEDILGIENVENYTAPAGTATKLIKYGIEEGKRRRFYRGRSSVFNPKIISIYEKLIAEGVVRRSYYFTREWDEELRAIPSAEELLRSGNECTSQEAIEFLQSFESTPEGFVEDAVVDCLVEF